MRRWPTRILICMLVGAVTTVAVAWGIALLSPQDVYHYQEIDVPLAWPGYLENLDWPAPEEAIRWPRGGLGDGSVGVTFIALIGGVPGHPMQSGPGGDTTYVALMVRQFGLPFRALQWEGHYVKSGARSLEMERAAVSAAGWRTGINVTDHPAPTSWETERRLPLTLLWPGFVINTLLFAALWLAIVLGFGAARRGLRKRRGRCPTCAYDLRGCNEPGCPECGWNRAEAEE